MTFHVDPVANKLQQYLDTGAGMSDLVSTIRSASGRLDVGGYSSGFGYDIDVQSLNAAQRQRFDALVLMIGMG